MATDYREVVRVAQGKSDNLTVITLACGHRQLWDARTRLPKVGSALWCSGCYSHGSGSANMKALKRNARQALELSIAPSGGTPE
mgnify:CR=1 FL=1